MADRKKLKYKQKNALIVKNDSQLGDVLSVCAVCGEIGLSAIKLFGTDTGEINGVAKYGRIKRNALKDNTYISEKGVVLYDGKAFNECGEGKLKTLRPLPRAYSIFDALKVEETSIVLMINREVLMFSIFVEWLQCRSGVCFVEKQAWSSILC